MGFNTTVVVLNDALGSIQRDTTFGEKLASAILQVALGKPVDVSAGGHCNAAQVVESHHADSLIPILVGGNCGLEVKSHVPWNADDPELDLLRTLAHRRGYTLKKRRA